LWQHAARLRLTATQTTRPRTTRTKGTAVTSQLVTVMRPLTVTTANKNPFVVAVGQQITVTLLSWWPRLGGAYQVSGSLHGTDGRQLRYFPGYEPTVRVDRLHRAVAHSTPLYRWCDRCQGTGNDLVRIRRSHYDWVDGQHAYPGCPHCAGTGHAKTYAATAA
jgi:hypothetical protein